jgi:hypothetical protein
MSRFVRPVIAEDVLRSCLDFQSDGGWRSRMPCPHVFANLHSNSVWKLWRFQINLPRYCSLTTGIFKHASPEVVFSQISSTLTLIQVHSRNM